MTYLTYFCKRHLCLYRFLTFFIFLPVFFITSTPGLALDPAKKMTQYIHDVWGLEDGLPQISVETLLQTRDGYLWLGTQEGLVRFDGVHFSIYNKRNVEQLGNNRIISLFEDQEGNFWIGTYGGGLTCLNMKNGKFTTFTGKRAYPMILSALSMKMERAFWIMVPGKLFLKDLDPGSSRKNISAWKNLEFRLLPNLLGRGFTFSPIFTSYSNKKLFTWHHTSSQLPETIYGRRKGERGLAPCTTFYALVQL